ncbi:flagellar filament capping protein FliD [Nocardioides daphniae]|uniref:Flagellar hook-associated protein 2 n=1 Tax=Nocardioides daphniae TaxID=402297 RepID=A0A4P7UD49_9ACTN|nr:flagellar filament capping protein FliD [Nocardioides daphniae]QCC78150.1 hypothetical protein E2C04_14890 [Nocardioides daphniae]GGD21460.1 flagellar hook-associated protein 2 [Nocardioides daphniae]
MATANISGLGSGLDTANIVGQLMQLEAMPQTRLQSRAKSEGYVLTSYQSLNSKVAALATKATSTGTGTTWDALKTTSSLPGVTVSATSSATPTAFTVKVASVALSHQLGYKDSAALTDVVTTGSTTVKLDRLDGTTVDLDTGDGTLAGLAAAINDPTKDTGLRATTVKDANGAYRLLVESTATGAGADFTLTNADGTALLGGATVRAGANARLDLGAGIAVESSSNTFTELMPGVTVTLSAGAEVGKSGEIAVSRDASTLHASVKGLVDNVNAILTEIDNGSKYNVATSSRGDFVGDVTVRTLRNDLASAIFPGGNTSMAELGLSVDRLGKLVLDEAALTKAYEADPAAVAKAFGTDDGFAARVATVAQKASDQTTGALTSVIDGRSKGIERLNKSIAEWDRRLELRESALTRQFTALDVALSKMNSQSTWLAGQINSLSRSEG